MAASVKTKTLTRTQISYSVFSSFRRQYCQAAKHRERPKVSQNKPPERADCDWIGPADKVSNIRNIRYYRPLNESSLQKELREKREETQEWHHQYWSHHNKSYQQLKEEFTKQRKEKKRQQDSSEEEPTVTSEEMSEFYKKFLDDNYSSHRQYNREWYKRNWHLLWLSLRVNVEKVFSVKKTKDSTHMKQ